MTGPSANNRRVLSNTAGKDQRINAFAGLSIGVAKTFALRTQNFDTLEPNAPEAWDGWIGLEAGWVFHIYQRAAKEYWY